MRRGRLRQCGLSLLGLGSSACAATQTIILDDRNSIIQYSDSPAFNLGPCPATCNLQPDPSQAYDGTWHDDTWIQGDSAVTVTIPFTGTSISIFNIIPDNEPNAGTSLSFSIDGVEGTPFIYTPSGASPFLYKHNVFSQSGLSNSPHTLVMSTDSGSGDQAILFDYAAYTVEVADTTVPPPVSPPPTTAPQQVQTSSPSQEQSPTSNPTTSPSSLPTSSSTTQSSSNSRDTSSAQATGTSAISTASALVSSPAAPGSSGSNDSGTSTPPSAPSGAGSQPQSDSSSSSTTSLKSPYPAMIAGILVGIAIIALAIFLLMLRRRRRRREAEMLPIHDMGPVSGSEYLEHGRLVGDPNAFGPRVTYGAASRSDVGASSSVALTESYRSDSPYREFMQQQVPLHPNYTGASRPSAGMGVATQRGHAHSNTSTEITSTYDSRTDIDELATIAAAVVAKGQSEEALARDHELTRTGAQRQLLNTFPVETNGHQENSTDTAHHFDSYSGSRIDSQRSSLNGPHWSIAPSRGSLTSPPTTSSDSKAPLPITSGHRPPLPRAPVSATPPPSSSASRPPVEVEQMQEQMGSLLVEMSQLRARQAEQEAELRVLRIAEPLPQYQPPSRNGHYPL